MTEWRSIRILKAQYKLVKDYITKRPELGYTSVPNFIAEAIRSQMQIEEKRLTELEKIIKSEPPSNGLD